MENAAPPSQHLPCGGSCRSLKLFGNSSSTICCVGNADCTLRLWALGTDTADEVAHDSRPMTFGGIATQAAAFDLLIGDDDAQTDLVVLAISDGPAGAVVWQ